ncbi:MAG: hypothetical protein J7M38_09295 [Armatimonadetes bacterium]|nr:hypothetical protein [Armatimonadota bacterium]
MPRHAYAFIVIAGLCPLVIGLTATAAPAQEGELEMGIDQLHRNLMAQLAGVWSQLVQGVAGDPGFLETAEGQNLLARQEALMQVRWMMMEGMAPPRPEGAMDDRPGGEGAFVFVSWIELDRRYWVLDTRTGRMYARECPEAPQDEVEDEGG